MPLVWHRHAIHRTKLWHWEGWLAGWWAGMFGRHSNVPTECSHNDAPDCTRQRPSIGHWRSRWYLTLTITDSSIWILDHQLGCGRRIKFTARLITTSDACMPKRHWLMPDGCTELCTNSEYKSSIGAYSLCDSYTIFRVCGQIHV